MEEYLNDKQKAILERSLTGETASNYSDAVDGHTSKVRDIITKSADGYTYMLNTHPVLGHLVTPLIATGAYWTKGKGKKIPTGMSNCTLTATQWINPNTPISRALTIIYNGEKYGYRLIPAEYALPGDLIIATNPNSNTHHTMLLTGFTKKPLQHTFQGKNYILPEDHPIVRYSNGTTHPSGYRRSVGLMEYLDNSEGKTDVKYYRHYDPNTTEVLLPEIVVTPSQNIVKSNKIQINSRK